MRTIVCFLCGEFSTVVSYDERGRGWGLCASCGIESLVADYHDDERDGIYAEEDLKKYGRRARYWERK